MKDTGPILAKEVDRWMDRAKSLIHTYLSSQSRCRSEDDRMLAVRVVANHLARAYRDGCGGQIDTGDLPLEFPAPVFAWERKSNSDGFHEPFDSRDAAVADAFSLEPPGTVIIVGELRWPDPGECVKVDPDEMLDRADLNAYEKGLLGDDDAPVFELRATPGSMANPATGLSEIRSPGSANPAEVELGAVIRRWARRWITPTRRTFFQIGCVVVGE
jgi:hypothetical protein